MRTRLCAGIIVSCVLIAGDLIRGRCAVTDSLGLSQDDVSRAGRLTHGHLSAIERGAHVPKLETIVKVARALEVTPADLVRETLRK